MFRSVCSRLKNVHKRKFKHGIQVAKVFPSITDTIRDYERMEASDKVDYKVFTKDQVHRALELNPNHPFEPSSAWVMKKAMISVALCGGLNLRDSNQ